MILYAAVPDSVPVIGCSPPSWAAHIALIEEGVTHEVRWLRFDRGEHRTPEMVALTGTGTVPVLVDGETVRTDTFEILEHIVARSAARALTPRSAERMARAREVKEAGMAALRARMTSSEDVPWAPVCAALQAFAHTSTSFDGPDLADVIAFVYAETVFALGCPAVDALASWQASMRARNSITASAAGPPNERSDS